MAERAARQRARHHQAVESLYALLLRGARSEIARRRTSLVHVRGEEADDTATQAADDALVAVLAKLNDFRGASRFTTWAYTFVLLETGVRIRRRAWQQREVLLDWEAGRNSPSWRRPPT
jgi:RNA polymerase sigma-70 factor (ECF subfamily)